MKKLLVTTMLLASVAVAQTLPAGTALLQFDVIVDPIRLGPSTGRAPLEALQSRPTADSNDLGGGTFRVVIGDDRNTPAAPLTTGPIARVRLETRPPTIGMFPETIILPNGDRYMLNAAVVDTNLRDGSDVNTEGQFKGSGHDGKDLTEIGFGTGGGMLIGGLISGGKGLLVGGTIGATLTVAHWLGKRRSAMLPAGTELTMEFSRPLAMTATSGGQ